MRTTARETVIQTALKYCSKEVGGNVSIYAISVKGGDTCKQAHILQKVATSLVKVTDSPKK